MNQPVMNFCGEMTLVDLAALIRKSDLLITVDTGATHIAATTGVKMVTMYGCTSPDRWHEYTGPKKPPIRRFGNRESGIKKPLLSDFLVCRFWARGNHHSRE